jgi:hypothetical protein
VRHQERRSRSVAEQDARGAVAHVEEAREALGAEDEHAFGSTGRDEALSGVQRREEARARRAHVERAGVGGPQARLDQRRTRRQKVVGRQRPDDDEIEFLGIDLGPLERLSGGVEAQIAGRLLRRREAPLPDPRALDDPLVGRVDELLEVVVRHDHRGGVRTRPGDSDRYA